MDAVEKNLYGWLWECANGGDKCVYTHALPAGYVLQRDKKDQEKLALEDDEDEITEAEVLEIETNEEIQVRELIKELKSKPDKSKKDQYNIELLEVKLRQLKNRK